MKTRKIMLGNVAIGGDAPVSIQTMCNTKTDDIAGSLAQIHRCANMGCDIIRLAVPDESVLPAFKIICEKSPIPVIADIHFDWKLAMGSLKAGADGIRVNPGNIRQEKDMRTIAREAGRLHRVVRIGVNGGSMDPEIEDKYGRTPEALVLSALNYVKIFEEEGCTALKVSIKSSDVRTSIDAACLFASKSDIPLHIGVTEAGPISVGLVKSAIGIGTLLLKGIGATIRVSLSTEPEQEVKAAKNILAAIGLRKNSGPELVSCPTCGRTCIKLFPIVDAIEKELDDLAGQGKKIGLKKIAIMGCEVNGPGEARDADVGIAGGKGRGLLFKCGKPIRTMPENELVPALIQEIRSAIIED
ncbi:MAG: flavodoxin-dependent (E)-4-hydroxy-3-methylbut-2-enyl-diphosphate synthase [Lentisphaeria bacterium]